MRRVLLVALFGILLSGCSGPDTLGRPAPAVTDSAPTSRQAPAPSPAGESSAPSPRSSAPGPDCAPVVDGLSTRQRVAQLLVVGVPSDDPVAATELVRTERVGGIFLGGEATGLLTGNALHRVHAAAPVPVSVAVDDEGGRVQRLDEVEGDIPSARQMARTMSPHQVHALAEERGRAMRERGVTVDYAPDVDLTDEPDDMAIGDRSFSPDPAVTREYARAFARGLSAAGVQPVLKHFPGHGNASGDSHQGGVRTPPLAELRDHDLKPYERTGEYGPAGVMVGHLSVPGLTEDVPASLSPGAYDLLRTDYRFDGPVVTDDLGAMRAISDHSSLPDAVLRALQAGADQALWSSGGPVGPVLDRLERAVRTGELPEGRVAESLERVLRSKGACG